MAAPLGHHRAVRRSRRRQGPGRLPRRARAPARRAGRMSDRLQRLIPRLSGIGVDAMLITDLYNVRYLTGYTGSNGVAVVGPEVRAFVTDFRYVEQAAGEGDASFDRLPASQDLLASSGGGRRTGGRRPG